MANSAFVSADITKFDKFIRESAEAVEEFDAIKQKFGDINTELLKQWRGDGADAYKAETDAILEKIGSVKDVVDSINEAVNDIKSNYDALDEDLAGFNRSHAEAVAAGS